MKCLLQGYTRPVLRNMVFKVQHEPSRYSKLLLKQQSLFCKQKFTESQSTKPIQEAAFLKKLIFKN